jgi:hypothetical protein
VTEQKRPQDEIAQARLLRHDPAQLCHRNREDPPRGGGDGAEEGALPGEHADLAEELRRTVTGDDGRPWPAVPIHDVGCAREQHDQIVGLVAIGEQHVTSGHVPFAAITTQHSELGRVQDGRTPHERDLGNLTAPAAPRMSMVR